MKETNDPTVVMADMPAPETMPDEKTLSNEQEQAETPTKESDVKTEEKTQPKTEETPETDVTEVTETDVNESTETDVNESTETDVTEVMKQHLNQWKTILGERELHEEMNGIAARLAEDLISGNLNDDTIEIIRKSACYDRDIADAERRGEIKGRNMRIDEYLIERRQAADLHHLKGAEHRSNPTIPRHIIGGLSAADRTSIWERGNEKRMKRG